MIFHCYVSSPESSSKTKTETGLPRPPGPIDWTKYRKNLDLLTHLNSIQIYPIYPDIGKLFNSKSSVWSSGPSSTSTTPPFGSQASLSLDHVGNPKKPRRKPGMGDLNYQKYPKIVMFPARKACFFYSDSTLKLDLTMKSGDFTMKSGDFTMNNGDFSMFWSEKMGTVTTKKRVSMDWFQCGHFTLPRFPDFH